MKTIKPAQVASYKAITWSHSVIIYIHVCCQELGLLLRGLTAAQHTFASLGIGPAVVSSPSLLHTSPHPRQLHDSSHAARLGDTVIIRLGQNEVPKKHMMERERAYHAILTFGDTSERKEF